MTGFTIKRARRAHARLRLGVSSVSGGGKTMGSLRIAKGIVQFLLDTGQLEGTIEGKIALIDSERKSAQLYATVVPFDTIELEPPYSVDRYQQAMEEIERAGYAVCIIDQISHAWAGPGGQLEWIDALKAKATNQISPWSKVTPVQQEFYDRLLRSPMHIIATMRAKSEWVIEDVPMEGGRTKKVPRKIGLSPVQREGIEYEFTAMLDIELESHMATSSKDRTQLFDGRTTMLDEACGRRLAEWLMSGEALKIEDAPKKEAGAPGASTDDQSRAARAKMLAELDDAVADYELGFIDCGTLPDLAAHFDKGQKYVRGFVKDLTAEVVKPYLDRLIAAKDKRKGAIQAPTQQTGEKPADPPPPAGDLVDRVDPNKLSIEDVKRLVSFAVNEGLDDKETLECLGVTNIADMPQNAYAEATDKIMKAARAKKNLGKPRGKRERAAA